DATRAPGGGGALRVGAVVRSVDAEDRTSLDRYVARISEGFHQPADVSEIVLVRVRLLDEDIPLLAEPAARPGLVRPAEAEREIGTAGPEHLLKGTLEQLLAVKPVVPVAEAFDSVW